jgi:diacylglycerol kinase family enzyme
MRHIFIINPFAGKNTDVAALRGEITAAADALGVNAEIYDKPGKDALLRYIRDTAAKGDPVRFYACGGDGTIYDVVNATFGAENVEIAAIPYGSGNDFVRIFGEKEALRNVRSQMNGTARKIDAIECLAAEKKGDPLVRAGIAVNQCSMGFDAEICIKQAAFKKIPWMKGDFSYTAALLFCLTRRFGARLTVQVDDNPPRTAKMLFALGGNSRWYGGGYKASPNAILDDGLLDCTLIDFMSRSRLIPRIGEYKAGKHLSWPETRTRLGKQMHIWAETPAAVNIDGETLTVYEALFALRPASVNFVVPQGATYRL